jgi:hypothetical protein
MFGERSEQGRRSAALRTRNNEIWRRALCLALSDGKTAF